MAAADLLSFFSQARGIKFYNAPLASLHVGSMFFCEREPSNSYDANCIGLFLEPGVKLGHLAREDAIIFSSLLRERFEAKPSAFPPK